MSAPFTLVFVCTANRARSPLAAAVATAVLPADAAEVRSYGTRTFDGLSALPEAVAAGDRIGVDIREHRSHVLDGSVSDADLVIGFELSHVATAVVDARAPRDRAFTLRELAELLGRPRDPGSDGGHDPAARARARVAAASAERRPEPSLPGEVTDPAGRPQRVFDEVAREIDALTRRVVFALFAPL